MFVNNEFNTIKSHISGNEKFRFPGVYGKCLVTALVAWAQSALHDSKDRSVRLHRATPFQSYRSRSRR